MLKKYHPGYTEKVILRGLPHMGDGLLMATEIGADTEGLGLLVLFGPVVPESFTLSAVTQDPNTLWVNKKGERFFDEGSVWQMFTKGNSVYRQPEQTSFTLIDENIRNYFSEEGLTKGYDTHIPSGTKMPQLEKELQLEKEKGRMAIANSWDEIAEWMGAPAKTLEATIEEYNTFCDQGHDEIFAKDRRYLMALRTPPFYAIKSYPTFSNTIGGIKINHKMEVLDTDGDPISGLYAIGVDAGGWQGDNYYEPIVGTALGFAVNSGRISGENAVLKCCSNV